MSNLRLFGMMFGCIGLIVSFLFYRGPKWKRVNFVSFSSFNILLIAICVNPNFVNIVRDIFLLQEPQYGRLLTLVILSIIFLLAFSFHTKSKFERLRYQFDKVVSVLSSESLVLTTAEELKKYVILIPAYNEEKNIVDLLPKIPRDINGNEISILVVDDGSEDSTFHVASSFPDVHVVKNIFNRGGGAALRLGYEVIKKSDAQVCITMDADGQHIPNEIERLIQPIEGDMFDFVIGSRILGYSENSSFFRNAGVRIFGSIISILLGKKITDPSSGFRAFKVSTIDSVRLHEDQYHTSELIVEAVRKNLRIGEVPISIIGRKYGKSKKGNDIIYGLKFLKTIINTWWRY